MSEISPRSIKILEQLCLIANQDGDFTEEERQFIEVAKEKLEEYDFEFKSAIEDEVIDSVEKVKLFKTRMKIIADLIDIAKMDENISPDEQKLLRTMEVELAKLNAIELGYSIGKKKE